MKGGAGAIGDTQTAVTARDVVTFQVYALAVAFVHNGWARAGETLDLDHLGIELERRSRPNA
jgi:hypothetical protein